MQTPYAGLKVTAGTVSQSFTTTATKLTCFSGNTSGGPMQFGANLEGDPAIVPDAANNWLRLNAPGLYVITVNLNLLGGGAADYLVQVRKGIAGVMTVQPDISCEFTCGSSGRVNAGIEACLKVNPGDPPGTIAMFSAPSGLFTGAGGWPQSQTTIDLVCATLSGSASFTIEYATFAACKME